MCKKILKRVYYAIDIELASPIHTSAGKSEFTDSDLLKNSLGNYFIPGTSIAGAIRGRMSEDVRNAITGFSKDEFGRMSSLFISDLYFESGTKAVRDGVKLNEKKIVDNKFDMEVLETGAQGTLYLNYVLREGDGDYEDLIKTLITDIQQGYIRFGASKNRGYGRMNIKQVYRQEFSKCDVKKLLDFDVKNTSGYQENNEYSTWCLESKKSSEDYVRIVVPLKLTGGISIRKYSARPNEADFEQITIAIKDDNGNPKPIIPGTSWNGAIRANVYSTLTELGDKDAKSHVDNWFGYVDLQNKSAKQSIVTFSESIIEGSNPLIITRNKINRFDASTIDGALYTEKSYFEGNTNLEILVKKDVECQFEAFIGILQIVIKDIQNGYVAIGGQTAVGRGIFAAEDNAITYENAMTENAYSKALYSFLMEGI